MMSRIVAGKSFLVVALILFGEALVCTQIPLLNYLGYEFSFFNALMAGFLCGLFAIVQWKLQLPSSVDTYWTYVRTTLTASFALVLVPLVVIAANAFVVKNCSFTQGFRLYLLYVFPSVLFCVSLGSFASVVARKHKKTLFAVLFFAVLSQIPYVTLTRPQIFAFNPIAGYFPGFTYDETFGGEARLLVYRVSTIAASAFLLAVSLVFLRSLAMDGEGFKLGKRFIPYGAVLVVSLVVCGGMYRISDTVGFSSSASFIAKQLGGVRYTEHFKIVYPTNSVDASRLRRIVLLHEYFYDELCEEWRVNPRRPITVFIYESPQQKERLIGAAATDFTKPWLRQVNINLEDVEGVLKHELVHAMLAEWGVPFLQVAPNSGILEGAAVATERFEYGESLHRLAAQILALGIQPNVAEMFTLSGFFQSYPGVSYILAGSFCKYLIDRYGVGKFKELYDSGNFQRWYGKDLDTLVAGWKTVLGYYELTPHDLEKAAYLFKRSPVFGKECARVIANLNGQTRQLIIRKEYRDALASAERSIRLSKNVDAIYQKSVVLVRLAQYDQAINFMESQFADSLMRTPLLPLHITLGDSYWAVGDTENARRQYSYMLADGLSASTDEAATIRLRILSDRVSRLAFKPYFLEDMNDSLRIAFLEALKESPETDLFARYLLGREHSLEDNNAMVVQELRLLGTMDPSILEYLRNWRLARAEFNLGNYESAKVYSWRALNFASNEAQQYQLEDLLRRCFWVENELR